MKLAATRKNGVCTSVTFCAESKKDALFVQAATLYQNKQGFLTIRCVVEENFDKIEFRIGHIVKSFRPQNVESLAVFKEFFEGRVVCIPSENPKFPLGCMRLVPYQPKPILEKIVSILRRIIKLFSRMPAGTALLK